MGKMLGDFGRRRLSWIFLSIALISAGWWGFADLNDDLTIRQFKRDGLPLRFMAPEGEAEIPAVIVAHGISVSKQIMLGYGYALTQAGYGVMMLDFSGHGANGQPFDGERLDDDLMAAYIALLEQPEVDERRVALLGQSMGSGAVMATGIDHPEQYKAVVAVSPTGADVSELAPPNLLLMAGALEGRFVENAEELLHAAGGLNDDFASGQARDLVVIPGVEHATILFSPPAYKEAVSWLDRVFGRSSSVEFSERRMLWYGIHLAGWLSLGLALGSSGRVTPHGMKRDRPMWRQVLGLVLAPLVATLVLLIAASLFDLSRFLGLLFGGALSIWLVVAGLVWLLLGFRLELPEPRTLLRGILFFALLWLAIGLMAEFSWLNWFLIPPRLALWPLLAAACLPWKLATGYAHQRSSKKGRVGWWLTQSIAITTGMIAIALSVPGLFVLILMAPAVPLVLALESIAGARIHKPWAYGLGSALFFGWLIVALFPIV